MTEGDIPPGADEEGGDLVSPLELAEFLTGVYRDEEASNFERVQAAVALSTFWVGVELQRVLAAMAHVTFVPVDDEPPPPARMN
jgi:hypothetical protein